MTGMVASTSFEYQQRVVAFIDVLGFSALVNASEDSPLERAKLCKLVAAYELFENFIKDKFSLALGGVFSDSFAISMQQEQLFYLVRETGQLLRYLLLQGFPCRGAVSAGSLFHHERKIIGPAFVKVVELEKTCAVYPRVILDECAMALWRLEFRIDEGNLGCAHQGLEPLVKRDRDGLHFIDIFHPDWGSEFVQWAEVMPHADKVPTDPVEFLKKARGCIDVACIQHRSNPKVLAKYEWLATECDERVTALREKLPDISGDMKSAFVDA